ncbi:MAG TPA: serine/threonine protein kinase, partial [Thermoleophilaceae bacterium]
KVIVPELAHDADFRRRFQRESELSASIDHPNVIPVYEAGEEDGRPFIAMRWVEGPDLRELIVERGPLAPSEAAALVAQVAGALDAAHARGLVHRDVKPANVLLAGSAEAPHAYLSDFGLARGEESTERLTRTGGPVLGTAAYAAPEQIEGGALDARADVYALACVLFFALSGRPPFRRDTELATAWAQVNDPPPTLRSAGVEVPAALELALGRALAKDPAERPESATGFADRVVAAVDAERPGDDARTVRLQRPRSRIRRLLPWLAGMLLLAAAGVALTLVLGGDGAGGGDRGERTQGPRQGSAPAPAPKQPAGPAAADPDADVVRCGAGACAQGSDEVRAPVADAECGSGGTWQRLDGGGDLALFACLGGAAPGLDTVPDLAGARLDRAETFLDERGIAHDTDGGGTFGIVMRDNWTVCDTDPPADANARGTTVTLVVDRSC